MLDITAIVKASRAFEIGLEAESQAPVQKEAIVDKGIADLVLLLFEVFLCVQFATKDRELCGVAVASDVGAEFRAENC